MLLLRNLRRTYVLITLLYSYVKTPYLTQQAFTCSKSTIETLEKGLKYVQSCQCRYKKDAIDVVLVSSLLTLNYFKPSPSFPIVYFELVNICGDNYLTFYSFDICFNVWKAGFNKRKAGLNKKQCREFRYFSYFTHSVRCNLCKPSNTGKFV